MYHFITMCRYMFYWAYLLRVSDFTFCPNQGSERKNESSQMHVYLNSFMTQL